MAEITSQRKWYAISPEESDQVRLRVTALRILKGEARDETVKQFFNLFGYEVTFQKFAHIAPKD